MKTLISGLFLVLICSNGFGQFIGKPTKTKTEPENVFSETICPVQTQTNAHIKRSLATNKDPWISFASCLADYSGYLLKFSPELLFPDTNVLIRSSVVKNGKDSFTFAYSTSCSIGEAFNPCSEYIGLKNLYATQTYKVDSISFLYFYERFGNNPVPDTLILQVYKPLNLKTYTYSTDNKPAFAVVKFDRTKVLGKNADYTLKVPIGTADTAALKRGHFKTFSFALPANFEITGGGPVGFTITYKPGITFKTNDTIPLSKYDSVPVKNPLNAFYCAVFQDISSEIVKEYNNGMIVDTQNRYKDYSVEFSDGYYLPGTIWKVPWYLGASFKISYLDGINENLPENGIANLFPNPAKSGEQINIDLNPGDNSNISVTVYDLTGHIIFIVPEGNLTTVKNSIVIPANRLSPGFYVVKVKNGTSSSTYKLNVE